MTFTRLFKMVIVEKMDLIPSLGGRIYVVCNQDIAIPNEHSHITQSKYPRCSCASFLKMHNSSICGRQPYVSCKHMYNLFLLVLHADEEDDDFIHNSTQSHTSLEKLLLHDPMV